MNYNFAEDLKDGQKGEQVIRHFVESTMDLKYIKDNDTNAFDLLFQGNGEDPTTFEVKTDLWEKDWNKGGSGNMAIEYSCRGKPSGIAVSRAKYFVYYLVNVSDKQIWLIETEKLQELLLREKFPSKTVGETHYDSDEKVAKCYMIPRFEYKDEFDIYTFDGAGGWLNDKDN